MESRFLTPRGIRNNNPGNIRHSNARWQGSAPIQDDRHFVVFASAEMGLRALMLLLLNYHRKFGLDSVESILNRFAPPHENATDHYIAFVAHALRVTRRQPLRLENQQVLIAMAKAIVRYENGTASAAPLAWYEDSLYEAAAKLAFGKEKT